MAISLDFLCFTPHDPTEDTESDQKAWASLTFQASFTPHDPTEDTESWTVTTALTSRSTGFTPHDPTEDTERSVYIAMGVVIAGVSPPTIRQRILKALRASRMWQCVIGFTPHDPTEDTERL